MKNLVAVIFVLLAGPVVRGDDLIPCALRDPACPLPADLGAESLFQARVEMELRRPGGARRDVLGELLKQGDRMNSAMWGNYVLAGCEKGILNCSEYLERATERAAKAAPQLRAFQENQRRLIAKETALAAMGKDRRHELYRGALTGLSATQNGTVIYRTEAAKRAMQEGFLDLIPTIHKQIGGWLPHEQREVARYVAVAKARAGANPVHALALLVQSGASTAVGSAGKSARGVPLEEQSDVKEAGRLASMALDALRQMGDGTTLNELKKAFEPYRSFGPEAGTVARPGSKVAKPGAYLGTLGREIVEAIGDFGDREFERRAVGGRTYWDKVNEAETQLVRQGKLRESEMVSR